MTHQAVSVCPAGAGAGVTVAENGKIGFKSFSDMLEFGQVVVRSGFAPKGMEKPESVAIAVQMGLEIGLSPMAAIQNIAVVNGRPTVWGDAALALVRSSGLLEQYRQDFGGKTEEEFKAVVTVKRKGEEAIVSEFGVRDAKLAGLWKKPGPWTQFPRRMLTLRARAFALRDAFADVLKGLALTEEAQDEPKEVVLGADRVRIQPGDLLDPGSAQEAQGGAVLPEATEDGAAAGSEPEPGLMPAPGVGITERLLAFADGQAIPVSALEAWLHSKKYLGEGEALETVSPRVLDLLEKNAEKSYAEIAAFRAASNI